MKTTFPLYVKGRKFEVLATTLTDAKKAILNTIAGIKESDIQYDYWREVFPVQLLRVGIVVSIAVTIGIIVAVIVAL